jgi:hypothetical protein
MAGAGVLLLVLGTTTVALSLHAVGGNCSAGDKAQQGWRFDLSDDTIKFSTAGCLSETANWATLEELEIRLCERGSPKQNFTFDPATGLVKHGQYCLALNTGGGGGGGGGGGELRLEVAGCGGRSNPKFERPAERWAMANGSALQTADGGHCIAAAASRPESWPPRLYDLWTGHDAFVPRGIYRIPSMITTKNGTLIVFAQARVHSTDATPSSVVMRRSFNDGETWEPSRVVLPDYFNATEQVGEAVYDPETDTIFFFENHVDFRNRHPGCSTCLLWVMNSTNHGLSWSPQTVIRLADPAANQTEPWGGGNRTFGGGLASGIALTTGPHKGRLLAALRHDCGCNDRPASFAVFSDDHGRSWAGGALLPEPGEHFPGMPPGAPNQTNGALGGWTECQVAELRNGSVLMTSRNLFNTKSGLHGRMFARSDDGALSRTWTPASPCLFRTSQPYLDTNLAWIPDPLAAVPRRLTGVPTLRPGERRRRELGADLVGRQRPAARPDLDLLRGVDRRRAWPGRPLLRQPDRPWPAGQLLDPLLHRRRAGLAVSERCLRRWGGVLRPDHHQAWRRRVRLRTRAERPRPLRLADFRQDPRPPQRNRRSGEVAWPGGGRIERVNTRAVRGCGAVFYGFYCM